MEEFETHVKIFAAVFNNILLFVSPHYCWDFDCKKCIIHKKEHSPVEAHGVQNSSKIVHAD